nr:F0F1 ATP synthase subunit alpha [Ktedonobacterales bacterium]
AFAQFGSDLDAGTKQQLDRGARISEILKQPQYKPVEVENQIMIFWAVNNGLLDDVPVTLVSKWEAAFYRFMEASHPEIGKEIVQTTVVDRKKISNEQFDKVRAAVQEFKESAAPRE